MNEQFNPNDPLQQAWATQDDSLRPADVAAASTSTADAHRKEQRHLVWLNLREIIPSFFTAAIFSTIAPTIQRTFAMYIAAGLFLFIGIYMAANSIRHHRADARWGASVREQMERRLDQLHHRANLYRTTPIWYFLPATVAMGLVIYALGAEDAGLSAQIFAGLFALTILASWRKAKKEGQVYIDEIERLSPILADFVEQTDDH